MGCCLTSWFSKKQTALDISTTEAEYVNARKACQQALWMKQALIDYDVIMPRKSSEDYKNTRHYIPIMSHEFRSLIKEKLRKLEEHYIHEGQVVFDNFTDLNYVQSLFHFIEFKCLLKINEQVCPCFILEFYSQYRLSYSDEGQMFVQFVIQNQLFSYSLKNFAQILDVPCEGACVFTDRWRLDELVYGIPSDGPYQTNPPSIEDIISSIRINREGQVRRIRHEEEIDVLDYQILTREIIPTLKPLEEIIRENVFCLGKIKLTIIPHRQLFVNISSDEEITTTPSPTITSSSPTPPNAPSKTPSTNQTSSSQDNTSSSFQSKLQISPPSSNEPTSPQPLNPLLENILDVPPRPLNPQPLQSLPSLDITLSLSPITPLEKLLSPLIR
ncbi:hypothetical protein Tco_0472059 [Tanacetum coccineum]